MHDGANASNRNGLARSSRGRAIVSRTVPFPLIRTWFADALVAGFDPELAIGVTDAKDRHVASAAAAIAPCVLVTNNLKDFDFTALAALGVTVRSPDDFLTDLFDANPTLVEAVTREAAANLTLSTPSWDEYLKALAERHGLPKFVGRLRSWHPKDVEEPAAPDGP
jgi:hypothetical protein